MHISSLSALLLQGVAVSGLTSNQVTILLIFAGAVTLAVVLQCIMLISFLAGVAKSRKEIMNLVMELKGHAMPLISSSQRIVEAVGPKVERAADNINEISEIARAKAVEIDSVTTEIAMRTRQRVRRVDEMVGDTIDSVDHTRQQVFQAAMAPVRHIVGILAGLRAGAEKAAQKFRTASPEERYSARREASRKRYTEEEREEMFGDGDDYTA